MIYQRIKTVRDYLSMWPLTIKPNCSSVINWNSKDRERDSSAEATEKVICPNPWCFQTIVTVLAKAEVKVRRFESMLRCKTCQGLTEETGVHPICFQYFQDEKEEPDAISTWKDSGDKGHSVNVLWIETAVEFLPPGCFTLGPDVFLSLSHLHNLLLHSSYVKDKLWKMSGHYLQTFPWAHL